MKDNHGRTIDYLRVSLTDRCNLRCIYCMPAEGIVQVPHDEILRYNEIVELVEAAAQLGIKRVRLTGGEPLVRKGVVDLVRDICAIPGIKDVSLTTNGILLGRMAEDLRAAGLGRVNVSLDTLDEEAYRRVTRGGNINEVLEGIDAALRVGFNPVKVNAVAVRSMNQDYFAFARMSVDRPLHMRFIEYMPVGDSAGSCGSGWGPEDVVSVDEIRESINAAAIAAGMEPLRPVEDSSKPEGGGPARYWEFPGAKGTVGFISPLSRHFCGDCNRLRLTSTGGIRPCLFSDEEYNVRDAVRYGTKDDVRSVLMRALGAKPEEHHEGDHARATEKNMNAIGG
ncbi:GTP 3',8-cyclase MoaA [Denitrobacterium detoxificans]|jgi:cyclic pyranopterin phosphate synthase|uniref:GTP 3',8-cyclase MoaA n=1 Tax=Denitrobacterium detoxificans TaxID=79604 RepID=UPI0026F2E732|nr:GTP 3',8-cyclase MoaA [Denitrobacterium detoxificans]MBE6465681.1 GTP 3',8-cyclase MoaA [Denitrobacterium detoxificans]